MAGTSKIVFTRNFHSRCSNYVTVDLHSPTSDSAEIFWFGESLRGEGGVLFCLREKRRIPSVSSLNHKKRNEVFFHEDAKMLFGSEVESSACVSGFKFHRNHTTVVLCRMLFVWVLWYILCFVFKYVFPAT